MLDSVVVCDCFESGLRTRLDFQCTPDLRNPTVDEIFWNTDFGADSQARAEKALVSSYFQLIDDDYSRPPASDRKILLLDMMIQGLQFLGELAFRHDYRSGCRQRGI